MKRTVAGIFAVLLCFVPKASAHRINEYLQATMLSIRANEVRASLRLIPGVEVSSAVIAAIDRNGDGVFSDVEQRDYALHVLSGLTVAIDGRTVSPRLLSWQFPEAAQMQQGLGEIHLEYTVAMPPLGGDHRFVLEQNARTQSDVYLVNALIPDDAGTSIVGQRRNAQQSTYELDFQQASGAGVHTSVSTTAGIRNQWKGVEFAALFKLGMHHIAEGTDHLLFLLTLLLPAPLLVAGKRWAGPAGVQQSLLSILGIVTAFTLGHSLTLGLAAFHVLHLPSRLVEVLVAASILVSAIHALRPIVPGKEAFVAVFFGLIHGLAFASTLDRLGLEHWQRMAGILAFNLGIEVMQLGVVVAVLPSLLLLSRTKGYWILRVGGAGFAMAASAGWIVERAFLIATPVDFVVSGLARHAIALACGLMLVAIGSRQFWFKPVGGSAELRHPDFLRRTPTVWTRRRSKGLRGPSLWRALLRGGARRKG